MPAEMCEYINRYWDAGQSFYKRVIELDASLRKENRVKFGTSDILTTTKFDKLVYEAMVHTNHNASQFKQPLQLLSRKSAVDEYQIHFTIEYTVEPCEGFKMTDCNGGSPLCLASYLQ
jgi:hypothetical protein